MLGELNDGHVTLSKKDKDFNAARSNNFYTEFPNIALIKSLIQVSDSNLSELGFTKPIKFHINTSANFSLIEFSKSSKYGYIRIKCNGGNVQTKIKTCTKIND